MKKILIIMLVFSMILSSISFGDVLIDDMNTPDPSDDIMVESVSYKKTFNRFNIAGSLITIKGENLTKANIRFESSGNFVISGTETSDSSDKARIYYLTKEETEEFDIFSTVIVDDKEFKINLDDFPNISGLDKREYIKDEDITFYGGGFNYITNQPNEVYLKYGTPPKQTVDPTADPNWSASEFTLSDPVVPDGNLGLQNIKLERERQRSLNTENYKTKVVYIYNNAFTIIEEMNIPDIDLFPTIGEKGDNLELVSPDFDGNDVYKLFFVNTTAEALNEDNEAPFVANDPVNNKIIFKVPEGNNINIKEYTLILTKMKENTIIGKQILDEKFTIIDANNAPRIEKIYPDEGPEDGVNIELEGKNIIRTNIPGLEIGDITAVTEELGGIKVTYGESFYKGNPVTVVKHISITIGELVDYIKENGSIKYDIDGTFDKLFLRTKPISDAEDDPYKDVVVSMRIELGTNEVSQYLNRKDGFKFIPSSLTPIINKVTPEIIDVNSNNEIGKDRNLYIEGDKFLVNRYTDDDGDIIINKPIVVIKRQDDQDINIYNIKFNPNATENSVRGVIYDEDGVVTDANGVIPLELSVYDVDGKLVDGTKNNSVGQKIILKIPEKVKVRDLDLNNILIYNPTRNSEEVGKSEIKTEAIDFKKVTDNPIIESISPDVVPSTQEKEVTIIARNVKEGAKLFVEGVETSYEKEISISGEEFLITFKTPTLEQGRKEILLMNPSGASAIEKLFYIDSLFTKPVIDNFVPPKGEQGSHIIINGKNFLKGDVSLESLNSINTFRAIGTRVFLDGKDVNEYNVKADGTIEFIDYVSDENPISDTGKINPYVKGVLFKDGSGDYFKLYKSFNNQIYFTNGKDTYSLRYKNNTLYMNNYELTVTTSGLSFNNETYSMITPFKVENSKIVGKKAFILNKNQISFEVPKLLSGNGYKDVKVVNPDTKFDEKIGEEGFYYIDQAASNPKIISIDPNKGSVNGGYYVVITGEEFDKKMKVYVDGALVPIEDTDVSLDGKSVTIKMPKLLKDLDNDFNVSSITVPVTILNRDGATFTVEEGFTYINPKSSPVIEKIMPNSGSTVGKELVEITGYEFRFFEPYDGEYGEEPYTDLNGNNEFDDLLKKPLNQLIAEGLVVENDFPEPNSFYDKYLTSPLLPKVYFGDKEGYIVEFAEGYLKVITPFHVSGEVEVFLVNNDLGASNKVRYTYNGTEPTIKKIIPPYGTIDGMEVKDIFGLNFTKGKYRGYKDDVDDTVAELDNMELEVRFAEEGNEKIARGKFNSGLINSERAVVTVGNLTVNYNGEDDQVEVLIEKNNIIYKRTFTGYKDEKIYIPVEMLKHTSKYYRPRDDMNADTYTNSVFEYVKVRVFDKRLFVSRYYAPKVTYDTTEHIIVYTPTYHTPEDVKLTITNPDNGMAESSFKYTFPASKPKIYSIIPRILSPDKKEYHIKKGLDGGTYVEILGIDFRENITASVGDKEAKIVEMSKKEVYVNGKSYDMDFLLVEIPKGSTEDLGIKYPIILMNEDYGIANSTNEKDIYLDDKKPMYFLYQRPLSSPEIMEIDKEYTSEFGGNRVTLRGKDFRSGARVIIDSKNGTNIPSSSVSKKGDEITFITPQGLEIGERNIKVENLDFGVSKEVKINIVSYPIIEELLDEKGFTTNTTSIAGGGKIRIKGQHFDKGAKVIFGGKREEIKEVKDLSGVFRNDIIYKIVDGKEGEVEFISDKEILVTAPKMEVEDIVSITIINQDKGLSDDKTKIGFKPPVPSKPQNLKIEVIDDRYIRIYDYTSNDEDYYQVYYYVGRKTPYRIAVDNYFDMNYLTTADREPFKLPKIKELEKLKKGDRLVVGIRAVNKYGSSQWSNLVVLYYKDLENIKELGDPEINNSSGNAFSVSEAGNELLIHINKKQNNYFINVSNRNNPSRTLIIPYDILKTGTMNFDITYDDSRLKFKSNDINTKVIKNLSPLKYAIIKDIKLDNSYGSYLMSKVPRGYKAVSGMKEINILAKNNTIEKPIYTSAPITMDVKYEGSRYGIYLYRYDESEEAFVRVASKVNSPYLSAKITKSGKYIILRKR